MQIPKELIERVEKAGGPDRKLGRELLLLGGWRKDLYGHFLGPLHMWSSPDSDPTASIDAALSLMERMLPGWIAWEIRSRAGRKLFTCDISRLTGGGYEEMVGGTAPTPALAIVLSTLRALESQP